MNYSMKYWIELIPIKENATNNLYSKNLHIYNRMNNIRQYGWKDWIRNPQNKSLYEKDMNEGLRQFKMEELRRNRVAQAAAFKQRGL